MLAWITKNIELYWGLFLRLDPLTAIALFLIYGILFERIYVRQLVAISSHKRMQAANLGTFLFLLSLWGLGEALKTNIMYAVPIASGTWVGIFTQVTIEKRKSEKQEQEGETSGEAEV